jgi:hypothetical protein
MYFQFQTELRKILISLIEASQKILGLNPEASKIFNQAEGMFQMLQFQCNKGRKSLNVFT